MEFKEEELENILQEISMYLSKPLNIYIFGGAVMVYYRLKLATKDIDLLFKSKEDYEEFIRAAKAAGFITKHIPIEYQPFEMSAMLQHPRSGWRLDLFLGKVCRKFHFNQEVQRRSIMFKEIGNLKVHFLSLEDIFLMKALTQRHRDFDDMNVILGWGIDFKVVLKEIENQSEHKWEMVERILEFEQTSGTVAPLPNLLRKEYEQLEKEKEKGLLRQQVLAFRKEGKSKKEIVEYFDLSQKEWEELKS